MTAHAALIQGVEASSAAAARRPAKPRTRSPAPTTADCRKPILRMSRPPAVAETAQKRMSGVMTAPAALALPPRAPCTKRGTYVETPYKAIPMSTAET